jgi:hypothetical protein
MIHPWEFPKPHARVRPGYPSATPARMALWCNQDNPQRHSLRRVRDDVLRLQIFISEFVIAVLEYFHVSRPNQLHDSLEGVAHEPMLDTLRLDSKEI